MDKDLLSRYRDLKRELRILELENKKLNKTEIVVDKVKASNTEFPYQEISLPIVGMRELTDREKLIRECLNAQWQRAFDLRLEIEDFINSIEDSRIRVVFRLRYIEGWSWLRISSYMGSVNESYARMIHDRFLEKI
ncbi:MAG: hypothetical protein SOR77_08035 [Peptoniphilus sp.]|uniref:hypothetical protein n=1 Tax=Peptoniphilus sp. TaxID=1971214 RepID=UPI002A750609|nr:hypothetical protein [Peptoniphilus sp.]MDY2987566.1 hypothetical protein [Peptoniphilus sp.]